MILVGHSSCSDINEDKTVYLDHRINTNESNEYQDAQELFEKQRLESKEMIEIMKLRKVLKRMKRKAPAKCKQMI